MDATGERLPRALLYRRGLAAPDGLFDAMIEIPDDPFRERWFYLNKLIHPFALTPFKRTLFLDSDTLVRRPLAELVAKHFSGKPVALFVKNEPVESTAVMGNHFIPQRFSRELGTVMVQNPDGGGHMYFESGPDSASIVARALSFVTDSEALYHHLSGNYEFVSDELALLAILTIDGIVLPARSGAVYAVQPDEVEAVATLLKEERHDTESACGKATIFHFFGQAKNSETYWKLLASIPPRWLA